MTKNLVSNEIGFFFPKISKEFKKQIILLQHFHVCTLLLFWINTFFCDKICEKKFCWLYFNFCSVFMHTTYLTGKKTPSVYLVSKYRYLIEEKNPRWSCQIYSILSPDREYWSYFHLEFSLSQDVSCAKWRKFRKFEKSKTAVYRSITQQHVLSQLKP